MPASVGGPGSGKPTVTFNLTKIEQVIAVVFDNNAITTNTLRDTFVNGATQAQINALVKEIAKCFDLGPPIP